MALLALLLLPGLLVVRSPWWAVPFLSLSYWWASWAWLAPAGPGRLFFLQASLAVFGLLLLLRLLRLEGVSRPGLPTLLASLAALAGFLALAGVALPVDPDLSFHALVARLLTWRDGIPGSFAPLLVPVSLRTHAPGLPFMVADAALLSGDEPYRLTLLGAGVGPGLLVLGAFAASKRWLDPWQAAALAVVTALAGILASPPAGASVLLASAFSLAALTLLRRPLSNARALSVGAFLGGAVLADLRGWLLAAGLLLIGLLRLAGAPADRRLLIRKAAGLGLLSGLLVAGPLCWRLAPAPFLGRAFPPAQVTVTSDDFEAMTWLSQHALPLDVVCIEPGGTGIWIPAVAGRAVSAPHMPLYLRSAGGGGGAPGPCTVEYGQGLPACPRLLYLRNSVYLCAL